MRASLTLLLPVLVTSHAAWHLDEEVAALQTSNSLNNLKADDAALEDAADLLRLNVTAFVDPSRSAMLAACAEHATSPVFVPQPDFSSKVPMKRVMVDKYPQEFYASIPLDENGITEEVINVEVAPGFKIPISYAVMPLNHHYVNMEAMRSVHIEEDSSHEFGELRWIGAKEDPVMAAMPTAVLIFAERFHVYDHQGPWHEDEDALPPVVLEGPYAGQRFDPRNEEEPPEVTANALPRSVDVFKYGMVSGLGSFDVAAAYDPMAVNDLKEHLASVGKKPTPDDLEKLAAIKTRFHEAKLRTDTLGSDAQPSSILTSCLHLLDHPFVIRDDEVLKVPLGWSLPTFRGQTLFSPKYQLTMATGKGFFDLHQGHLVFYQGATAFAAYDFKRENLGTPSARSTYRTDPTLFISAPGGTSKPSAQVEQLDLRATPCGIYSERFMNFQKETIDENSLQHKMYLKYATTPVCHTFLFESMDETCPPNVLHALDDEVTHSDWMQLKRDGMEKTQQGLHNFSTGLIGALQCGRSFLRAAADYSNGLDYLEMFVWSHFLMEFPSFHRMEAIRGHEDLENGWHWKKMAAWSQRRRSPPRGMPCNEDNGDAPA